MPAKSPSETAAELLEALNRTSFDDIIKATDATWHFKVTRKVSQKDLELLYAALALSGEAGELANKVKKHFRYKYLTKGHAHANILDEVPEELVDTIYYVARTARVIRVNMNHAWKAKMGINLERYGVSKK